MPGTHITDQQARLYMHHRRTHTRLLQSFGACAGVMVTFATGLVAPNAIAVGLASLPEAAGAAAAFVGFLQVIVGTASAAVVRPVLPGTVTGMVGAMRVFGSAALGIVFLDFAHSRGANPGMANHHCA